MSHVKYINLLTSLIENSHFMPNSSPHTDRNFDPIAEHFAKKVYGGLKGDIRLAVLRQDIFEWVTNQNRPLRILDIGAGLAQISIDLASRGHEITVNEIAIAKRLISWGVTTIITDFPSEFCRLLTELTQPSKLSIQQKLTGRQT